MNPGRLITFEGLDGCGKSTQAALLAAKLRDMGREVIETREPGGTAFGEQARALLLHAEKTRLAPQAELALMFASRAQLVAELIQPALARGAWVVCDRFVDSSEAYQGAGRGLGVEAVHLLRRALVGELQPDLTFWLVLAPGESVARARGRQGERESLSDSFERESRAFFERVHAGYHGIALREPQRFVPIVAAGDVEAVHSRIDAELRRRFTGLGRTALPKAAATSPGVFAPQ